MSNNAGTIRFSAVPDSSTPKDYHFYIGDNGVITKDPSFGAEGAREKQEMIALMRSDGTPEQYFASATVGKLGKVTKDQLRDTIVVFERFVKIFAGNSPERRARAYGIMAMTIIGINPGASLGEVYTEMNRNMMFQLGYLN